MEIFHPDECDKLFSNRSHLNRHMKAAHLDIVKVDIEILDNVDKALEGKFVINSLEEKMF